MPIVKWRSRGSARCRPRSDERRASRGGGHTKDERRRRNTLADLSRTLDQIEGVVWGPPEYETSLVVTCHRLRTKPLGAFSAEDRRIMISQHISVPILAPLALRFLERDPFVSGKYYPGDLLSALLSARDGWISNPELAKKIPRVLDDAEAALARRGGSDVGSDLAAKLTGMVRDMRFALGVSKA